MQVCYNAGAMVIRIIFIILAVLLIGKGVFLFINSHKPITQTTSTPQRSSVTLSHKEKAMTITSTAFADHTTIPTKYTCDGQGVNPPLMFENVSPNAKSLALLVDDPDVPKNLKQDGVFDHWVLYNIDPQVSKIDENNVPSGAAQGLNGAGQEKFTPPCPPDRQHRYFFNLYALDTMLGFPAQTKVTKQMVLDAMKGHIIQQVQLIGVYNRPQNK